VVFLPLNTQRRHKNLFLYFRPHPLCTFSESESKALSQSLGEGNRLRVVLRPYVGYLTGVVNRLMRG
jgi:hypothetical protein